jgi:hypothetical protein
VFFVGEGAPLALCGVVVGRERRTSRDRVRRRSRCPRSECDGSGGQDGRGGWRGQSTAWRTVSHSGGEGRTTKSSVMTHFDKNLNMVYTALRTPLNGFLLWAVRSRSHSINSAFWRPGRALPRPDRSMGALPPLSPSMSATFTPRSSPGSSCDSTGDNCTVGIVLSPYLLLPRSQPIIPPAFNVIQTFDADIRISRIIFSSPGSIPRPPMVSHNPLSGYLYQPR